MLLNNGKEENEEMEIKVVHISLFNINYLLKVSGAHLLKRGNCIYDELKGVSLNVVVF